MDRLHSYPKVYNLGHPALEGLLEGPVVIEEKVDGSQISFGVSEGVLLMRSKGAQIYPETKDKLFRGAVDTIIELESELKDGWTYRGEVFAKPKHNSLAYDRIPNRHIILFDIERADNDFLPVEERQAEAERLGLESIPVLWQGEGSEVTLDLTKGLLETVSALGGQKVEGVVIKNHSRFGVDGKALMGKHVSEAFREVHAGEWKKSNPGRQDIMDFLVEKYRTPARWDKAVQHLAERGELENSPRDIGKLINEAKDDVAAECKEEIMEALWNYAWPKIARGVTGGLPEWYKDKLLESQFDD